MTWQESAACQGADPDLFFKDEPVGRPRPKQDPHAEARAYCGTRPGGQPDPDRIACPVILSCLKWATDNREYGFAGGMSATEREAAKRRKTRGRPPLAITRDDEATRERLYREGLNDPAIAAEIGRSPHNIRDWRYARGYPPNQTANRPIPGWRLDLYQSLWQSGSTDRQIAELAKSKTGSVKAWRRKNGYQPNRASEQVPA